MMYTVWAAKADNSAVSVAAEFFLLSSEKDCTIAHSCEIVSRDRVIDSLHSSARRCGRGRAGYMCAQETFAEK